jgi:hypothetical protein
MTTEGTLRFFPDKSGLPNCYAQDMCSKAPDRPKLFRSLPTNYLKRKRTIYCLRILFDW